MIKKYILYSYDYIFDRKIYANIAKLKDKINKMDLDLKALKTNNPSYRNQYYNNYLRRKKYWTNRLRELIEKENKKRDYWTKRGFKGSLLTPLLE